MSASASDHCTKPSSSSAMKLFGFLLTADHCEDGAAMKKSKKLECHYCGREFENSQAYGGHQNAHRKERKLAMMAKLELEEDHHQLLPPQLFPTGVVPLDTIINPIIVFNSG